MTVLIKLIRLEGNGQWLPPGTYLMECDHEAHEGRGAVVSTPNLEQAMRFADLAEAMRFWNKQSTLRPLREDGKPNKPLTAFTIEVVKEESTDDDQAKA
jgi:hypothetical protein